MGAELHFIEDEMDALHHDNKHAVSIVVFLEKLRKPLTSFAHPVFCMWRLHIGFQFQLLTCVLIVNDTRPTAVKVVCSASFTLTNVFSSTYAHTALRCDERHRNINTVHRQ